VRRRDAESCSDKGQDKEENSTPHPQQCDDATLPVPTYFGRGLPESKEGSGSYGSRTGPTDWNRPLRHHLLALSALGGLGVVLACDRLAPQAVRSSDEWSATACLLACVVPAAL